MNGQGNVKMPSYYSKQNSLKCQPYNIQTPTKPFKLFTDASKNNYSRILYEEEQEQADTDEPGLIPIVYFSGTFNKTQQLWNTIQKECYAFYRSAQKLGVYLRVSDCA